MTSGTCGQPSTTSSKSARLQQSLVSRLQAKAQTIGSTLYTLTWKPWVLPSGRSRSRLRASVHRTSGTVPTGWPTPQTSDCTGGGQAKRAMGETRHGSNLNDFAMLAAWPTPVARDYKGANDEALTHNSRPLNEMAKLAGWGTPACQDDNQSRMSPEATAREWNRPGASQSNLAKQAAVLASWATPCARDHFPAHTPEYIAEKKAQGHGMANLNDQVQMVGPARLTARGELLTGSCAEMESGGQLNPAHSRWLMGLPPEWDDCAVTAMLSMPTRRKSSLKR